MSKNQLFTPVRVRSESHTDCAQCGIRPSSLFRNVALENLPAVQQFRETQLEVTAGQTLFYEGDTPSYVYTLLSGWVILYQTSHSGKRQILRFALPGDFVGLQVNGAGAVAYSVDAMTDATFCAFRYGDLSALMDVDGAVAKRLLAMQIRDSNLCQHHLMGAGRKSAEEKIAFLLLELFHRAKMQIPNSDCKQPNSISFPVTQEDIADAVGLSKIHVNRILRDLVHRGYINCERKCLTMLQEKALAALAEFEVSMIVSSGL